MTESGVKKAVVTGSSRGIGRAVALALGKLGYEVTIHCASRIEKAREVAELIEENGGKARVCRANLSDLSETKRFAEEIADADILVLNASVQIRNPWQNISVEEAEQQLNCNFVSSLLLIQAVVPHMKEQGFGRIITVGSVQEAKPHPDMLVYSASKAAQTNMMQSLSLQLAPFGITVNNVAPGVIYTDRNVEALSNPEYAEFVKSTIPVGFYGKPEDLTGIVELLISEKGRYITGQSVYVDGGKSIQ